MGSLPLPGPKSPPGKRRELEKVVMLEKEILFLEEELKSFETLQPASFCIKEVADYMVNNPEPLITVSKKTKKSCGFWKWLCGNTCFNMPCVCYGCSVAGFCSFLPKCSCGLKAKTCLCCNSSCCPKCKRCWPIKCWCPRCCGCCSLENSYCYSSCCC